MHHARTHRPAIFRPLLGNQRCAHRPFAADADPGKKTKRRERPDICGKGAQQRKERKANNREHQRPDAAEPVGNRPPQQGHPPANQKQREEDTAVITDIPIARGNSGTGQQFPQRGNQNERVDERIHPVQHPTSPSRPESADLVARERDSSCCHCAAGRTQEPARRRPIKLNTAQHAA